MTHCEEWNGERYVQVACVGDSLMTLISMILIIVFLFVACIAIFGYTQTDYVRVQRVERVVTPRNRRNDPTSDPAFV